MMLVKKTSFFVRGFTLIELMITLSIVAILASISMPMLQLTVKRNKEVELKSHLMEMREAIDAYKKASDEGRIEKSLEDSGYPPNLEVLVDGVEDKKDPNHKKIKFLRRIPADPMHHVDAATKLPQWGLRSYQSDADNPKYENDVYDIYSLSTEKDSHGMPYAKW